MPQLECYCGYHGEDTARDAERSGCVTVIVTPAPEAFVKCNHCKVTMKRHSWSRRPNPKMWQNTILPRMFQDGFGTGAKPFTREAIKDRILGRVSGYAAIKQDPNASFHTLECDRLLGKLLQDALGNSQAKKQGSDRAAKTQLNNDPLYGTFEDKASLVRSWAWLERQPAKDSIETAITLEIARQWNADARGRVVVQFGIPSEAADTLDVLAGWFEHRHQHTLQELLQGLDGCAGSMGCLP